jgi:arylsulfatase A-like enzyme
VGDHNQHDWWRGRTRVVEPGYATDLINRYSLEFIERHREQPFCLYIAHLAIHNPVQVRGDPVRRTEAEGWKRWKPASESERIEKLRGMTLPIDEGVGQIREALVRLGLDRQTLVLFFSDNGASADFPSGSPQLRGGKGTVYEGGHKVPFIAWWPGRISAGTVNDTPAITLDIMPTLIALAGAEIPREHVLDGVDLSAALRENKRLPDRPLYWASLGNNGARSEALRDGPWKLVVQHPRAKPGSFDNESVELYRLDQDPGEEKNLAPSEPNRAGALLTQVKTWYADVRRTGTQQPGGW